MDQQPAKDRLIVLTGGAGFIGSCFLWKLNQAGEKEILVVDHLAEGDFKAKNLAGKSYRDFIDKDDFIAKVRAGAFPHKVKAIWHIGACSSTMMMDAEYLRRNNTEYSQTLAEWALQENIPFYYASSAATYGDGSLGYSDEDQTSLKLKPLNPYGQSKQDFDLWLIQNKLQNKVVGFKYFNVFGPNEYHKEEMSSLVFKAYDQITCAGKIRLFKSYKPEYKDGEQKRDFVYVKDAVEVMWEFSQKPNVKGIYNLGTGLARSWNDLAAAIFGALDLKPDIEYIEMPEKIKDRYQYYTEADLAKLRRAGIKHEFRSLEGGVADYVRNYLAKGMACL